MEQAKPLDLLVEVWLETLDLSLLADWDVLVFLYRHRASLASAEQIARLLGYTSAVVGDALDRLESLGLVQRSRASQGVRLLFLVSTPPALDGFQQLMSLAENRNGRLLLAKKLRQRASRQQARDRDSSLQLVKGSATWPKAV
jgi:DNA-binding MarR family transcriptional regulator